MMTTNAYRLFINRLCRSCPLKTQCSIYNKLNEDQVDVRIEINSNKTSFERLYCVIVFEIYSYRKEYHLNQLHLIIPIYKR